LRRQGDTADSYADHIARAAAWKARIEGRSGLLPVHRYEPPATPTEAERIEADRARRAAGYAAAMGALQWW
jgi:hypothetical protein